jgi:hypothetical protein
MNKNLEKICIRPVIDPEGYEKYERICQQIAKIYFTTDKAAVDRALILTPKDSRFVTIHTLLEVGEAKCPAYWISRDLLTALMQSQMQVEPETLHWAMKVGMIMLPLGMVRSPGGYSTQAILWHVTDRELFWVAICEQDCFCRRFTFGGNKKQFTDTESYDPKDIESFNNYLQSVFLRIMVLMEARPELIEESAETTCINRGFAKNSAKTLYQPHWIGKEYRLRTQNPHPGGIHASRKIRMHWRKGFLRLQAWGEGRKQRKLIWIEPTLVMGAAELSAAN